MLDSKIHDDASILLSSTAPKQSAEHKRHCIRRYYLNKKLASEAYYRLHVLHGECKTWFPNGQLEFCQQFREGELHGRSVSYFANGQVFRRERFVRGQLQGLQHQWGWDGTLEMIESYEDGLPHGLQTYANRKPRLEIPEVETKQEITILSPMYIYCDRGHIIWVLENPEAVSRAVQLCF